MLKPFLQPKLSPHFHAMFGSIIWCYICMFETIFRPSYLPYFIHYLMLCWNHLCKTNYLHFFTQCLVVLSDAMFETNFFKPSSLPYFIQCLVVVSDFMLKPLFQTNVSPLFHTICSSIIWCYIHVLPSNKYSTKWWNDSL